MQCHSIRHEHLYEKIQDKLIRSDELPHDLGALERSLGDTCIMLSTLSMLSNPALDIKGVFKIVPVLQLVVDEASQINLFDFMVRWFSGIQLVTYTHHPFSPASLREIQGIEKGLLFW
jgi:hypothetical protein